MIITLLALAARAEAQPAQRMTFRNNLVPGHLTVHRVSRTTYRTAKRKNYTEKLKYRQQARWVQCNVAEPRAGSVMVYQMMVDQPVKVLSLRRGKKKTEPTPPAAGFNLPKGSTRLHSAHKTPYEAPVQVPLTDPAQRAILHALLDFAHWPKKKIEAGHRWQRDLRGGGIRGTQTFEFVDMAKDEDVVARLTLFVEGQFEDPIAKDYVFGKGQAILYWSRLNRVLIKMEARAEYQRRRANAPEKFKLKLDVGLTSMESLNDAGQDRIADQLIAFDKALKAQRGGDNGLARDLCRQFRDTWPDSLWMPAVDELENRTVKKVTRTKRLSTKQLSELLVKTILTYEAARSNFEYDLLERTRHNLQSIADDHHAQLKKLTKSKDASKRSRSLFALAFSSYPADLTYVQKAAQDPSHRVRAMVLAALAARRSPETSVDLLIIMLDDEKAVVRRRACDAVAACLPPEHYSAVKAVEKLGGLLMNDETDGVRLAAVRALAAVGAPADIPKLEEALGHELDEEIREEIQKAIEMLEAKKG